MNKKGFTTVELILTMAIVIVIMGTISGVTYNYRDRSNAEEEITEVTNFKNSVTKTIYDDIFDIRDNTSPSNGKVLKIGFDDRLWVVVALTISIIAMYINWKGNIVGTAIPRMCKNMTYYFSGLAIQSMISKL